MKPASVLVAIFSLFLAGGIVIWLAQAGDVVTVTQEKAPPAPSFPVASPTGPHPKVKLDSATHDFGKMQLLESGEHIFTIKNTGEAPLKLKNAGSTCQCTIGELEAEEIAPGGSTDVKLTWTIKVPNPTFSHSAKIRTNDPNLSEITLEVKGRVVRNLGLFPEGTWTVGTVTSDSPAKTEGFIWSGTESEFEITDIQCDAPNISFTKEKLTEDELLELAVSTGQVAAGIVDVETQRQRPIECAWRIRVSITPGDFVGPFTLPLVVETSIKGGQPLEHQIAGSFAGSFDFFPKKGTRFLASTMQILGGTIEASKGAQYQLLLIPRGIEEPLIAEQIVTAPDWLKVSLGPASEDSNLRRYVLSIDVPPNSPRSAFLSDSPAQIRLKTNHPKSPELRFSFTFIIE